LPFPLLSDTAGEVCRAYGACDSSSTNRVSRNTYIINPNGVVLRIDENVDPENQAEMVLAFLREALKYERQDLLSANQVKSQPNVDGATLNPRKGEQGKMDDQASELDLERDQAATMSSSPAATDEPSTEHRPTIMPSQVQPAQSGGPSLVYALGTIGYDLVSEARRDSIMQHMNGNPNDPGQLLAYLEKDPSQAAAIVWTLNLDATPIYAIQPRGAFAELGYKRLQQFLQEQVKEGVERVSIAGIIAGQVQLMSGQVVPVIWPELRCMYSWTIAALIKAVSGQPPAKSAQAQDHEAYARKTQAVANFLERVYHELRNLGPTPQERAINYAATNAMNVEKIFEAALKENMELDTIEVERSPICRLDSDCWDVKLTFFNPSKVLEQARKVYRFTVDVSDVCPVMVGKVRSWSVR
jgi:cyanobactin maturation PatA/PatG family protease